MGAHAVCRPGQLVGDGRAAWGHITIGVRKLVMVPRQWSGLSHVLRGRLAFAGIPAATREAGLAVGQIGGGRIQGARVWQ